MQQCVKLVIILGNRSLMAYDETSSSTSHALRRWPRSVVLAGAALTASWAVPAHASTAYAYMLATAFEFGGGCTACHTSDAGGLGTVTKPFGRTLMRLGLKADDTQSLEAAVTALSTSDEDSDGDTIADFDELSPEGDPNDPEVFPQDAIPVPPAPPPPATSTAPTPPATIPPSTPTPTAVPTGANPPAPPPSPEAGAGEEASGCSLQAPNGSMLPATLFAVLGLALVRRRR